MLDLRSVSILRWDLNLKWGGSEIISDSWRGVVKEAIRVFLSEVGVVRRTREHYASDLATGSGS